MEYTGGIYVAKRNGTCQHCGHRFFSSSPTPGTLCVHCKNSMVVRAKMQERETDPEPPTPAVSDALTWSGHAVNAPGFTADQFDRAMGRAFIDELQVKEDREPGRYLVGHPSSYAYAVTRVQCTCKAGQVGTPCKHRAILVAHLDIRMPAIAKRWAHLNQPRSAGKVA